jgi:hypothetical protein
VSVTRAQATTAAKSIAQDPGGTAKLLLADGDYDSAIDEALEIFRADRPNLRIHDVVIAATGFRYVLGGTGSVLPTSGLQAWIVGGSQVRDVFLEYDAAIQDQTPIDRNLWLQRFVPPDGNGPIEVLELRGDRAVVGSTMRLEYVRPHVIDASTAAATSILAADVKAFEVLVASKICEMTARRYVQNTGTSTFQSETVDRRTQSDVMASRAKNLREQYAAMVGKPTDGSVKGAGTVRKFDVLTQHRRGRLWHLQ